MAEEPARERVSTLIHRLAFVRLVKSGVKRGNIALSPHSQLEHHSEKWKA